MNLRETRIRMEKLGNTLKKMGCRFEAENIVDRWNGRKIIPLAMMYRMGNVYITPTDEGFKMAIEGLYITEFWYARKGKYNMLVLIDHDNREIGRLQVKTR